MRSRRMAAAMVVALAALPHRAAGQDSTLVKLKCDDPRGGRLLGTLVEDRSGAPLRDRGVILSFHCWTRTDSLGRFEIAHIPPGRYRVVIGTMGYRELPVPVVTLAADSVVRLDLRLRPENAVLDCEDQPACAAVLRPDSAGVAALTDEERLRYGAWRTALALSGWRAEPAADWVPCLEEPDSALHARLLHRYGPLARPAQCGLDPKVERRTQAHLLYLATGQQARHITVRGVELTGDRGEAHVGFLAGALWGVWWDCRFRRRGDDWAPESCRIEGVS